MREWERLHGGTMEDGPSRASEPRDDQADYDESDDSSRDSFPASDPPSSMGMRVGGPRRAPEAAKSAPRVAAGVRPARARTGQESHRLWMATQWPHVRIRHVEVRLDERPERDGRETLRAVVQLSGLTPADVTVTAQRVRPAADSTLAGPLRLWSVQSHQNGEVVFEAAVTRAHEIDRTALLRVMVEAAGSGPDGSTLAHIVRLVETNGSAGCASQ